MYGNSKFSDQICAEDVLTSQKFLSANYNTAVQESSNTDLRKDFMDIQRQEQDAAFRVFSYMNQKGWYRTSPADSKMINEARSQAQQIASQIGFGFHGTAGGATGFAPGIGGGAGFAAGPGEVGFGYQGGFGAGGGAGYQGSAGTFGGAGAGYGFGFQGGTGSFGAGTGGNAGYQGGPGTFGGQAGGAGRYGNPTSEASKELGGTRFEDPAGSRRDTGERTRTYDSTGRSYGTYGDASGSDGTASRTGRSTVVHGDTELEGRTVSEEITGRGTGNIFEGSTGFEERSGFPGGTSSQGRRM